MHRPSSSLGRRAAGPRQEDGRTSGLRHRAFHPRTADDATAIRAGLAILRAPCASSVNAGSADEAEPARRRTPRRPQELRAERTQIDADGSPGGRPPGARGGSRARIVHGGARLQAAVTKRREVVPRSPSSPARPRTRPSRWRRSKPSVTCSGSTGGRRLRHGRSRQLPRQRTPRRAPMWSERWVCAGTASRARMPRGATRRQSSSASRSRACGGYLGHAAPVPRWPPCRRPAGLHADGLHSARRAWYMGNAIGQHRPRGAACGLME